MRHLLASLSCSFLLACGAGSRPVPATPPGGAATAAGASAVAHPADSPRLPPAPAAAPPAPPACLELVDTPPAAADCAEDQARDALAAALEQGDWRERDRGLASLESCPAFAPGLVRTLRADLAPVDCGDTLVGAYLDTDVPGVQPALHDALIGLALAGRLHRLVRDAPIIKPPFTKERFREFLSGELGRWVGDQAAAVNQISSQGAELRGYGRGVAAVEAGLADMRFVEVVREVPLPEELTGDQELVDTYYMALDEALEPRKTRGRDAALVGLKAFASLGVLEDPRVERARELLSKLYSGRRIDRLDHLLLPPLEALSTGTVAERLAARLPTFYAEHILGGADPTDPALLRALIERGLAPSTRKRLEESTLSLGARRLYARALVRLGQRYWQSGTFARAAEVGQLGSDGTGEYAAEAELVTALATALSGGPRDAAEMMLRGPFLPAGVGNVTKLDAIAASASPWASLAAFDAAFVLELVPPVERSATFWESLAERYEAAARKLTGERRVEAERRGRTARETAAAIAEAP